MFRGRAWTLAAVTAVFLASAPPAAAGSAGCAVSAVVRTITWRSWSAGPDGVYRATTYRKPFVVHVPYVVGVLSASSRASASRR